MSETKIYYDAQIDVSVLSEKTVAIIGYGAQGRAHALNLRDSNIDVLVGQRPGNGFQQAIEDGFQPVPISEAVPKADLICLMLPDEQHGPIFEAEIKPSLRDGQTLLVCHGFSLLYETVTPPPQVGAVLVAPKGAGHMVRTAYQQGGGVPCLVAITDEKNREVEMSLALAYAAALGGGKAGIMETTVREETETDLFGEQAVLCGGVSHLAIAAFETLVEAGYREEIAYFECVHELKLVVDLLHRGGLAFMRDHISNTAEYGDYTRGPKIVDQHVKETLKQVLQEIRSGEFAKQWIEESASGNKKFDAFRQSHQAKSVEATGKSLHQRMKLT